MGKFTDILDKTLNRYEGHILAGNHNQAKLIYAQLEDEGFLEDYDELEKALIKKRCELALFLKNKVEIEKIKKPNDAIRTQYETQFSLIGDLYKEIAGIYEKLNAKAIGDRFFTPPVKKDLVKNPVVKPVLRVIEDPAVKKVSSTLSRSFRFWFNEKRFIESLHRLYKAVDNNLALFQQKANQFYGSLTDKNKAKLKQAFTDPKHQHFLTAISDAGAKLRGFREAIETFTSDNNIGLPKNVRGKQAKKAEEQETYAYWRKTLGR